MRTHLTTVPVLVMFGLASCSSDSGDDSGAQSGGTSAAAASGGAAIGVGGASGGSSPGSGGTFSGGTTSSGGASSGGTTSGGTTSGGGTPSGGAPSGGAGFGGSAAGSALGGGPSAGGSSAGGAPSGGAAAGGSSSGGAASGGTSGGGSAAGGSANGGNTAGGTDAVGGAGGSVNPPEPEPELVLSGPNGYWVETELSDAPDGSATVTVNESSVEQEWLGFCGSFNEAGWDALGDVSAEDRQRAIELLFHPANGAGFDWGRIPIGASDYAMDRYTLNDTAGDYAMTSFSIARDRERLIPFVQAALAVNRSIRLWASPWTPPAWMKEPAEIDGTNKPPSGSVSNEWEAWMRDDAQTLDAFALYLARFVEEYAAEGIPIDHVQPQNEPGYSTRYPSCRWEPQTLASFVGDHLGPLLTERGLDTGIWFGTLSNSDTVSAHLNAVQGHASARGYLDGYGFQWNTMSNAQSLSASGNLVMQTEHKCGNYPWNPAGFPAFNPDQPPNDHAYAVESWGLIRDWLKAGVHIYSAWNMVLDTAGKNLDTQRPWPQNALLVVDRNARTVTPTPAYYVFRHVSQFVDPGARRLGTTGSNDALAFKNPDESIVVIVHNPGDSPNQMSVAVGASRYQFTVPNKGWATVNLQP